MIKRQRLLMLLAGCLLASGVAGGVSAQPWTDRDWDDRRGWRDRGWDDDRGWEGSRQWRGRDRNCYYERRREHNRFGEIVVRRYRVCED